MGEHVVPVALVDAVLDAADRVEGCIRVESPLNPARSLLSGSPRGPAGPSLAEEGG